MNLQTFITKSLVEIMNGLKDAQSQLHDSHARICPTFHTVYQDSAGGITKVVGLAKDKRVITFIEFDVAVTITEATGTEGGISVIAGILSAGMKGKSSDATSNASRISFKVPVVYPDVDK